MHRSSALVAAAVMAGLMASTASADLITIETVPVGNAGNAADGTSYGRVDYVYNIGKYEVTAGQYTAFLNGVAGVDTHNLYNTNMWTTAEGCKIERYAGSGTISDPYLYRVGQDYAHRPVNFVSFWSACRFANWLNNGQGGAGTTEDGAYALTSDGITNNTVTRNAGATWAVTNEDEWYKAAYYDPTAGSYYLYPTSSNMVPGRDLADAAGNNANYFGTPLPIQSPYYTTAGGAFQNSDSSYGTFDQGGNVWEWNEAIINDVYRGQRGGSFLSFSDSEQSGGRYSNFTTSENRGIGFRVAQVPEPTSLGVLGIGVAALLLRRKLDPDLLVHLHRAAQGEPLELPRD
jgi:formylglycine-generating enzyme